MPHPSSRAHLRIRQTPLAPKRAYDHYGLVVYETEDGEYAVGTDLQVQKAAEMAIENDVWAFKASFIASVVGLSRTEEKAIEQMQRDMSEDAGPIIKRLIGGKMKQFIRDTFRGYTVLSRRARRVRCGGSHVPRPGFGAVQIDRVRQRGESDTRFAVCADSARPRHRARYCRQRCRPPRWDDRGDQHGGKTCTTIFKIEQVADWSVRRRNLKT